MSVQAVFKSWLVVAVAVTGISGMVELAVQQNYRMNANDPQVQYSQDVSVLIGQGNKPADIIGTGQINMRTSLATFLMFFDKDDKVIASSATLDSQTPTVPADALAYAKAHGENRITWAPQSDVRIAAVITYQKTGDTYILAGRSLKEVEKRESQLMDDVLAAWIATLVVSFLVSWMMTGETKLSLRRRKDKESKGVSES